MGQVDWAEVYRDGRKQVGLRNERQKPAESKDTGVRLNLRGEGLSSSVGSDTGLGWTWGWDRGREEMGPETSAL